MFLTDKAIQQAGNCHRCISLGLEIMLSDDSFDDKIIDRTFTYLWKTQQKELAVYRHVYDSILTFRGLKGEYK
jgi:hypothetical protein